MNFDLLLLFIISCYGNHKSVDNHSPVYKQFGMIGDELATREADLLRELEAVSINFFICRLSEELSRCQILVDESKCKNDICIQCFKKHKTEICMICAQSLQNHYKKGKTSQKNSDLEDASKLYNRLIANFDIHPQGKKYSDPEKQVKRILENQKKQQRTIITEATKVKQAHYIGKIYDSDKTGRQSCGCPVDYNKGMTLICRAFNFSTSELVSDPYPE